MSFSFVDHILEIEPGRRARGTYLLPARWEEIPPWLIAEAIGQLAAWTAIAGSDFRRRPVAAIAGEVVVRIAAGRAGATLELEAEVERREENSIVYRGSAVLGGRSIGELKRCLGPMLPMAEFDDPEAVRRKFARLCSGAPDPAEADDPLSRLVSTPIAHIPGAVRRVRLEVPRNAPFFTDHFPRKPVFPATLLLDLQARLAVGLAGEAMGAPGRLSCVRHVKVRAFTPPGSVLELEARVQAVEGDRALVPVRAAAGERTVATARVEVEASAAAEHGRAAGENGRD